MIKSNIATYLAWASEKIAKRVAKLELVEPVHYKAALYKSDHGFVHG